MLHFSSNQVPTVEYILTVTNVYPLKGSLMGGTKLTISGSGFEANDTEVLIGTHKCVLDTVTTNQITCTIEDTATVHQIDNTGVHFGEFSSYSLTSVSKHFCSPNLMKGNHLFNQFVFKINIITFNASTFIFFSH